MPNELVLKAAKLEFYSVKLHKSNITLAGVKCGFSIPPFI